VSAGRPRSARAAIVAIGDELLEGRIVDANSGWISARLAELGIKSDVFVVRGDDADALEGALRELCAAHALVIATGGLGPTLDDVTREAAARAAGVGLATCEEVLEGLRESYRLRGREMPASNVRQALLPEGAERMANRCGTAPGFRMPLGSALLAALPGPPHEMRDMFERELAPWLGTRFAQRSSFARARFLLAGLAESAFADRAGSWMERNASPRMGVTARFGVLEVTLHSEASDAERARALLEPRAREFRQRFGSAIFSEDEARLEFVVGRRLLELGLTVATAESCTGGLVAELLTEVPGISAAFREGWITYSDEAKVRRLGVPRELLEKHGAVSSEVARAMAEGAARESGAELALAVTGIAGPGGGSAAKPVGLVWIAVARRGVALAREMRNPPVDRASIRRYAAHAALDFLRTELELA